MPLLTVSLIYDTLFIVSDGDSDFPVLICMISLVFVFIIITIIIFIIGRIKLLYRNNKSRPFTVVFARNWPMQIMMANFHLAHEKQLVLMVEKAI